MMDFEEGDGKISNIIVIAFSFIVIAVVIIGFASSIRPLSGDPSTRQNQHASPPPESDIDPICSSPEIYSNCRKSAHKKTSAQQLTPRLDELCVQTDYVATCKNSLAFVAKKNDEKILDFLLAAINISLQETKKAKDFTQQFSGKPKMKKDQETLLDCLEMMSLSVYDLESAKKLASNSTVLNPEDIADMRSWLSAVLAYQEFCREGLEERRTIDAMDKALQNPKEMTSIALTLLASNSTQSNQVTFGRRLLGKIKKEYPRWLSNGNRKMFEAYDGELVPDATVSASGKGKFKTIGGALKAYKLNSRGWYVIQVKAGTYKENIVIPREQTNVFIYGEGMDKTIVSGSKHSSDEVTAYKTAVFTVLGKGFVCKSMSIRNEAKLGNETVALRVQADKAAFFNCKIVGTRRTLYALAYRQFYRECIISGSHDFIYGDSITAIQRSLILIKDSSESGPSKAITVQSRSDRGETTGFVIEDCTIIHEDSSMHQDRIPVHLGRPGGEYSRIVLIQNYIGNVISPEGWNTTLILNGKNETLHLYYAEYENHGPGSDTKDRIKFQGVEVITDKSEAQRFTLRNFIQGDYWLERTGIPRSGGLV